MELEQKFSIELGNLTQAIATFKEVLAVKESKKYTAIELDLIKNGKIQKFEYCTELAWKVSKIFLELKTAEIFISPKMVYKNLLLNKFINEQDDHLLFKTLEDRNKLSHIYKEEEIVNDIFKNLELHLSAFQHLILILNK
ncbi:MAG: nucleotidyltransferase substrate binding protein [Sphingobacteriales bacterium]|nr:nucleotidyltransferase substrate binding protein [Sphingobacteriales bacterium]